MIFDGSASHPMIKEASVFLDAGISSSLNTSQKHPCHTVCFSERSQQDLGTLRARKPLSIIEKATSKVNRPLSFSRHTNSNVVGYPCGRTLFGRTSAACRMLLVNNNTTYLEACPAASTSNGCRSSRLQAFLLCQGQPCRHTPGLIGGASRGIGAIERYQLSAASS
jgi:hypothetical protein